MSRIEEATRRLEQATDALEAAVERRLSAGVAADPQAQALADELRAENERLRDTNADIAARLDAAIARLQQVLEG